jgi:hypothetical protein
MRGLPISWHRGGGDWRALAGAFGADSAVARTGRAVGGAGQHVPGRVGGSLQAGGVRIGAAR